MTAPIRSHADLIEALRARKNELGLSNRLCDDLGGLTSGHTDKVLGPTGSRGLTPLTLDVLLEMFAVELVMRPNLEAAKRMEARWERRAEGQVAPPKTVISKQLIEKAAPHVIRTFSAKGGAARAIKLTGKLRSKIARKGGLARAKKARKQAKAKRRALHEDSATASCPNAVPQAAIPKAEAVLGTTEGARLRPQAPIADAACGLAPA